MKKFYGGIFISKEKLLEESKVNLIKVEYYEIYNENNYNSRYGIEVVKTEYKENDILTENIVLEKITDNENVEREILNLFKRNEVTPISANEIIEDLIKYNSK